tara:strand:+ start:1345 stop:2175 length:831 start_codon:yes stop_codon:yes gene_type:complete
MPNHLNTLKVTNFINQSYGLDIPKTLKPLARSELEKFKKKYKITDWNIFFDKISLEKKDEQISELLEIFLIDHTKFFRNYIQFEILKEKVLPYLIGAQSNIDQVDLRIWSAGCSSGEEVFSLLVVLFEYFGEQYHSMICGVLATDISKTSLKKTELGVYRCSKITSDIRSRLESYVEFRKNETFRFHETLRNELTVRKFNLNTKTYPFKKKFHIIFCRNVLLYFNKEQREITQKKLILSLKEGGFIFLGDAENLDFTLLNLKKIGNGIYQKRVEFK